MNTSFPHKPDDWRKQGRTACPNDATGVLIVHDTKPCTHVMMRCPPTVVSVVFSGLLVVAGCSDNPVTGERELSLFSTAAEIDIGKRYYRPLQQSGNGLYTVDPALTDYVNGVGQRVAAVSDRSLPYEFVVLNTSTPNAWALPGGKIAITRGLLVELENEAELAAVLGHEVVHAAARHGTHSLQRGILGQLILLAAAGAVSDPDDADVLLGAGGVGLHLFEQNHSRDAERDADYFGMKYMHAAGYDTAAAVTLQEKFVALSRGRQPGWLEGLFASHPPSSERVRNNRAALADFPEGGEQGGPTYIQRIAYLQARTGAYEKADRAQQLLDESPESALHAIESAIRQEPREPLFHGIKGRILARQGQHQAAIRAFDAAIRRDTGYYGHYLGRGLAYDHLGQRARARRDLERSSNLLPTAEASHALAGIALADGDREKAKRLYRTVSRARGELGREAREAYVKLDLVDFPGRYITVGIYFDEDQVVLKVANSTSHEVRDVMIEIETIVNGVPGRPRLRELPRVGARSFEIIETGIFFREEDAVEVTTLIVRALPTN